MTYVIFLDPYYVLLSSVETHLAQLEKDHKAVLQSIQNTGRSMLLKLTAADAKKSVLDYRSELNELKYSSTLNTVVEAVLE